MKDGPVVDGGDELWKPGVFVTVTICVGARVPGAGSVFSVYSPSSSRDSLSRATSGQESTVELLAHCHFHMIISA